MGLCLWQASATWFKLNAFKVMKNSGDQSTMYQSVVKWQFYIPSQFRSVCFYGYKVCIRSLIMHLWANLIIMLDCNILNFTQQIALW